MKKIIPQSTKQNSAIRKICVFTGTRAEYGILKPLINGIQESKECQLQILVSGTHLSPEFGLTYQEIEKDGFEINEKVEMILSSDTAIGISKSLALGLIGCTEAIHRLQPDLLIILGDRFEALSVAIAAMLSSIPIAHIHGGEATFGVIDEPIRHSITKMSHIHFTSTEGYRQRVIQLGEKPDLVFNVGSLGVENINQIRLLSRKKLAEIIGFWPNKNFALVTFHPVTLEQANTRKQFIELLIAFNHFPDLKIIFTKANADPDGRIINHLIEQFITEQPNRCQAFTSMGQTNYLSAMSYSKIVVGNSSSGIIEAPSLHTPTINIGDRQKGRIQAKSVLNCQPTAQEIILTMQKAFSDDFQDTLNKVDNPYEKAQTTKNIIRQIKQINLTELIKKEFYDIPFSSPA